MVARSRIKETMEAEQSVDTEKKKMGCDEDSIFSTILADIEQYPTILQKTQTNLSSEFSIFNEFEKNPVDFSCTVSKTLSHSDSDVDRVSPTKALTRMDLVNLRNQELKILKSENEVKVQASDCVEERKVEQREEVVYLTDNVLERISKGDLKSENSTTDSDAEDGNVLENSDEMVSTMLGDEVRGCGDIDEFIEEMLEKIENDGSYLEKIKDDFLFGGLLEELLRKRLREKAEKKEWINNGESVAETGFTDEEKEKKTDIKKTKMKTPVKRTEQESTVTKQDCIAYGRQWYLIEQLREREEKDTKRRAKAMGLGVEFSFLVAEYMFSIPNDRLASMIDDYWMSLKRLGVSEDDKGTSVIIRKLEEVLEIVMRNTENKEYYSNRNLPEPTFGFDDFILLCTDAIQVLGKIVWALRSNQIERVELADLNSWFEHCEKVLGKIELKLAVMDQQVYRSFSADYESFSKSERFDSSLKRKIKRRYNAENRFGRSISSSYLVEIWEYVFEAEAIQEEKMNDSKLGSGYLVFLN